MQLANVQKRAVVIGASSGLGLSIADRLIQQGYYVYMLDRKKPAEGTGLPEGSYEYVRYDMTASTEVLKEYSQNPMVDVLFITAGIGRIAEFETFSAAEIELTLKVNAVGTIKVIREFYDRIKSDRRFYCGVVGSIAGLVSSPLFSVYAASKAAICRFTESVNIELEAGGFSNRILNVSPGYIAGTGFYGEKETIGAPDELAEQILKQLFSRSDLFIPDYDKAYKNVLHRYRDNSHQFGMESFSYKMRSGRIRRKTNMLIGYLSGTFDLFHIGHLNLIRRAKEQCDYLIVGVHPNAAHKNKETYISFEERVEIVRACRYVDEVVVACREDCDAWEKIHFDRLFVGSDYKGSERFERYEEYFRDKDVRIIYFPYTQITSSSQLRDAIKKQLED